MTTKIFKTALTFSITALALILSGCLHSPEVPFIEPNPLSQTETQRIEKVASHIFSDLLFESPLGDRSFSSLTFKYDPSNPKLKAIDPIIKKMIQRESTVFYSNKSNNNLTYILELKFVASKSDEKILVNLIDNQLKKPAFSKQYLVNRKQ